MIILPIILCFNSFFISFFGGRFFNKYYAGIFTSFHIFLSLLISIIGYYEIAFNKSTTYLICFPWMTTILLDIQWSFLFDTITVVMLIVILSISLFAHIYSIEYMFMDPNQIKFMSYLSLFTFFMLLLVTSNNLLILFVGWEGVGISSYLLINFWHTRLSANKSAIMAMFVNKFGDISLLISFTLIYSTYYTFDYNILFPIIESQNTIDKWICFFFMIGAVGKSAQIGLHTWLPEAMEGPTPVSSLIHAATMVTAGIFLIIRTNICFQIVPDIMLTIIGFGSISAFVASTIGIFQFDIKKIIAYSTASQLGYMFLSCGLEGFNFSLYHLVNHAFFKALLFLTAGYIIHAINNEQDLRKLGGLLFILPFAYIGIMVGSLSLLGFPFLSGFFSKEKIIELFFSNYLVNLSNYQNINILFFFQFLANIAVIFTILYSIKILIYSFFYSYQNNKDSLISLHYSSIITTLPLFLLCILSVCSGYLLEDMMVGFGSDFFNQSIYSCTLKYSHYFEFNLLTSKLPIISILYFSIIFFILFYFHEYHLYLITLSNKYSHYLMVHFNKKYITLNKNIIYPMINFFFRLSYLSMYRLFDKGIIELIGPFGISKHIYSLVKYLSNIQTGFIYHYSGIMILSIIIIIHLFIF